MGIFVVSFTGKKNKTWWDEHVYSRKIQSWWLHNCWWLHRRSGKEFLNLFLTYNILLKSENGRKIVGITENSEFLGEPTAQTSRPWCVLLAMEPTWGHGLNIWQFIVYPYCVLGHMTQFWQYDFQSAVEIKYQKPEMSIFPSGVKWLVTRSDWSPSSKWGG